MISFILAIGLAALTLLAVSLQKSYTRIPAAELKRRAQHGDEFANMMFKVAGYGTNVEALLWVIVSLCAAGFFVVAVIVLPVWFALIVCLVVLWLGFAWLPKTKVSGLGNQLARWFAGPITWLLSTTYPLLSRLTDSAKRSTSPAHHTGLYQKEDLLELLDRQNQQSDNRISKEQLQIARNALTFGDKLVRDIMTPRSVVKMVGATDTIGPVLMNELHDSGYSHFPVYKDTPDKIVGLLYLRDLVAAKEGGQVRHLMAKDVYYVQEEGELDHVLQAFLKTKRSFFIVVNNFEELVGVVTIEDIVEQILGKPIIDEFDHYEDMRAVAALKAEQIQKHQVKDGEVVVHLRHK